MKQKQNVLCRKFKKKRGKTHTFIIYYQNSKLNDITKCRTKIAQNNLLKMKLCHLIRNNAIKRCYEYVEHKTLQLIKASSNLFKRKKQNLLTAKDKQ